MRKIVSKLALLMPLLCLLIACNSGGNGSSTVTLSNDNRNVGDFTESNWEVLTGTKPGGRVIQFAPYALSESRICLYYLPESDVEGNTRTYSIVLDFQYGTSLSPRVVANNYRNLSGYMGMRASYIAAYNGTMYVGGNTTIGTAGLYAVPIVGKPGYPCYYSSTVSPVEPVGKSDLIPGGYLGGATLTNEGTLYIGANHGVKSSDLSELYTGSAWENYGNPPIDGSSQVKSIEPYNGYVYALLNNSEIYISEDRGWYIVGGYAPGGDNHGATQQMCRIGSNLYAATQSGNVYVTKLKNSPIGTNWSLVGSNPVGPSNNVFNLLTCDTENSRIIATTYDNSSESAVLNHIYISNVSESLAQGTAWQILGKNPILPNNSQITSMILIRHYLFVGSVNAQLFSTPYDGGE